MDVEYWRDGARYQTRATLEERERCAFDIGSLVADASRIELRKEAAIGVQSLRLARAAQELLGDKHLRHRPLARHALQRVLHLCSVGCTPVPTVSVTSGSS